MVRNFYKFLVTDTKVMKESFKNVPKSKFYPKIPLMLKILYNRLVKHC